MPRRIQAEPIRDDEVSKCEGFATGGYHLGMATAWRDLVMSNPAVMHGQACIKGTRIPVSVVLGCLADGMTVDEILADYPSLSPEAISAALGYGAALATEELLPLPEPHAEG